MSNFTATGMFVPMAFALAATRAPITLLERSHRFGGQVRWVYEVRYRDKTGIRATNLTVGGAQLEAARDPGEFVSSMIVAMLHEVRYPDQALVEAQSLADYVQDGGTFEAELIGGFHDGGTFPDLPLDREYFPPPELVCPVPRPWAPDGGAYPTAHGIDSVTYRRDRLDPARRVWLYRFGK